MSCFETFTLSSPTVIKLTTDIPFGMRSLELERGFKLFAKRHGRRRDSLVELEFKNGERAMIQRSFINELKNG